jgi:riboflavin synthase alpha subunit
MFTGIVTQRATVAEISSAGPGAGDAPASVRLSVRLDAPLPSLARGDSVAIDGVCLTVVAVKGPAVGFDVVPESLRRTTLRSLRPGSRVNVEPALRVGDVLGGHVVQGHVDGVGTVERVERRGDDVRLVVSLPPALHGATIPKGSVTLDGVSLTVGESEEDRFSVYLVPHTLAVTGLSEKREGAELNVEADVLGRWVEHHVRRALEGRGALSLPRDEEEPS